MNTATTPNLGLPPDTEQRAAAVLRTMGLTVLDACRIVLTRIAVDGRFPFVDRQDAAQQPGGSDKREQDIVRERAQRAFATLRSQAILNGTADMPLDEINEEIRAARAGEGAAA